MRIKLFILIFVFLMPVAFAEVECSKVFVVNFNYDDGLITYKGKVIKCGYAPDRKVQPEEGYTAEIMSIDNKALYSFKFDVPLKFNFDMSDPLLKSLSGGMLILNETDFALLFPYYDKAKSIIVYNPRDYKILTVPLIEEQFFIEKRSIWWVLILAVILLIIGCVIYRYYKNKKVDY